MFVRYAFFRGRVKAGYEDAFTTYVRERLLPLWLRFPGAEEMRIMRQVDRDDGAPPLEMVLAVRYPSREAIDLALASEVRAESRRVSTGLLAMFDGDVFHTIFRMDEHLLHTETP
jgi:hypothetical protein